MLSYSSPFCVHAWAYAHVYVCVHVWRSYPTPWQAHTALCVSVCARSWVALFFFLKTSPDLLPEANGYCDWIPLVLPHPERFCFCACRAMGVCVAVGVRSGSVGLGETGVACAPKGLRCPRPCPQLPPAPQRVHHCGCQLRRQHRLREGVQAHPPPTPALPFATSAPPSFP